MVRVGAESCWQDRCGITEASAPPIRNEADRRRSMGFPAPPTCILAGRWGHVGQIPGRGADRGGR